MRAPLAFLLAALALAGCGAPDAPASPAPPSGFVLDDPPLRASALVASINATPGHRVTFPFHLSPVRYHGEASVEATVGGRGAAPVRVNLSAGETVAFVPLDVPPGQPAGPADVALTVRDAAGARVLENASAARLRVLSDAPGYAPGASARVVYAGRLEDGAVFNTNDPRLADAPFPKAARYSFSDGALAVASVPVPSVVPGFHKGMLGMQAGESRTVTFGPEEGYGNATLFEREARVQALPRDERVPRGPTEVARGSFDAFIAETGQGDPADYGENDTFRLAQGPNVWTYRLLSINASSARYVLEARLGERYTVYPFWPLASEVVAVEDASVVLRTTPATRADEPFTMRQSWPDMTALVSFGDESILVRHSPPVGLRYTSVREGRPAVEATVHEVTQTTIVSSYANPSPLAGRTLTFDILVLDLAR
ncbi:MAG TPA: FKBP-type peptidyl-prolyl cis-trans isomerase [Candidatus Thermoplasmatota archaeon]|nr:FKBP-type peptidyl-prolyl cis-trans isomerase [Candidatus Thermoplasmatota archaeon]